MHTEVTSGEEALAARIQTGDAAAEEELAVLFRPRAQALLAARLRDREAARELVGEVLMGVIRALRQGRLRDPAKLAAFVAGTARNVAFAQLRRRASLLRLEPLRADALSFDPVRAFEAAERLGLTRRELAGLGATDRRILEASLVEGKTALQIGRALGMSHDAVRARKSRALRRVALRVAAACAPPVVQPTVEPRVA
jgi:RNA polymerase sigma-70 factor (ECF subfamily)